MIPRCASTPRIALLALMLALPPITMAEQAQAQQRAPAKQPAGAFGNFGANSKDPIKIDADKLDVIDREGRAIYSGNVVAVQAETTVRCTTMTIFYTSRQRGANGQAPAAPTAAPASARPQGAARGAADGGQGDAISKVECAGPVTIVSKTQTATAKNAVFDRRSNQVILTGDVAVADGPNITRGERIVYDTQTGVANVQTAPGGRVRGVFVPGSDPAAKPVTPGTPAPRGASPATN
jgi:lipopolysaccharide export system protein LptA